MIGSMNPQTSAASQRSAFEPGFRLRRRPARAASSKCGLSSESSRLSSSKTCLTSRLRSWGNVEFLQNFGVLFHETELTAASQNDQGIAVNFGLRQGRQNSGWET